jgi:hypothetical protein
MLQSSNFKLNNAGTLPQSSILSSNIKSSDHLKISQQYSLLNLAKKELNIHSSTIGLTITPTDSSIS